MCWFGIFLGEKLRFIYVALDNSWTFLSTLESFISNFAPIYWVCFWHQMGKHDLEIETKDNNCLKETLQCFLGQQEYNICKERVNDKGRVGWWVVTFYCWLYCHERTVMTHDNMTWLSSYLIPCSWRSFHHRYHLHMMILFLVYLFLLAHRSWLSKFQFLLWLFMFICHGIILKELIAIFGWK